MTQEQYKKAIEIGEKIKYLKEIEREINCSYYDHRLAYTKYSQIGHNNEWRICPFMSFISDILDRHDKMIRQEIKDRIEEFNEQIEKL